MQIAGAFRPCEDVAREFEPGSAVIVDHATLTVRWLIFQKAVAVELPTTVLLPAPDGCD